MIPDPRMTRIYEPEDEPIDYLAAADFLRDEPYTESEARYAWGDR